jgi:hypothetical protein
MVDSGENKDAKRKSYRVVSLSNSGKKPAKNDTVSQSDEINEKSPIKNFNKYASKDWGEDDVKRVMMEGTHSLTYLLTHSPNHLLTHSPNKRD